MLTNKTWNLAFIFHGIAFGMLPILIPLYFIEYLKGSIFDFGIMSALAVFFSIMTSVYAGRLPEKYGRVKPFILISFILSSIFLFALTRAMDIHLFQLLYILLGVVNSLYSPSVRILIAETYQKAEWSKIFAQHNLIVGLSNTLGLAFCSLSVASLGYGTLLIICAPLGLVSFFVAFIVVNDPPIYVERWLSRISRVALEVESFSYWLDGKGSVKKFGLMPTINMALFGLGILIFTLASSAFGSSLSIYFSSVILITPSTIFSIFFGRSLIGTISYIVVGRLIDEDRGKNAVKVASIVRALLVFLLPSLVTMPQLAPIMAVLLLSSVNFMWSLYSIGYSTVIMDYASEGTTGVYDALGSIGSVIGSLLSGIIPAIFSFNLLFILASLMFLIAFLIFWKS